MTVGESICLHRKKHGLSQEELGKRLLVSRQTVSLWEKNKTLPTIDNLLRLKEIFGVSIDEILCAAECIENKSTNSVSIESICATLAYAMGISPPKRAAEKNAELSGYIDRVLMGKRADRIVMFNPDAIPQWIYEKYPQLLDVAKNEIELELPFCTVMPSVTPVCFGTMYTGAQPAVHGIRKYEKPVIKIDTLFDALIRAGKKPVLITYGDASLGRIFLERKMDYFHYEPGREEDANAKAVEILLDDAYDFIVIYNGNYDSVMHKFGPESPEALGELRANCHFFGILCNLVETHLKKHNTLVGFAMDHGCHEIDGNCGSHGLDMVEDINIVHCYTGYPKKR
jgi:transcriptional regulator with XRE-family HTH domain